jgi:hypothetical protein
MEHDPQSKSFLEKLAANGLLAEYFARRTPRLQRLTQLYRLFSLSKQRYIPNGNVSARNKLSFSVIISFVNHEGLTAEIILILAD